MYINRRQVLEIIHKNGMKGSKEFCESLNHFVVTQINAAVRDTKHKGKVILKGHSIRHLLPEVNNGR